MGMSRKPDGLNRRTVLKMSGVSLAGIGVSTSGALAAGEDEFKRKVEESQRVKQSTQDVHRWLDYLETKGIYGDTVHQRYTIRKNNGNNSSSGAESKYARTTQDPYEEADLDIYISLVYNCDRDDYYAELTWRYDDNNGDSDIGQDPLDAVGMHYKEDWWKLRDDNIYDTTSTSEDVTPKDDWGFDFEGPGYSMNDYSAQLDDMESNQYYAGVYIVPRDEDVDPEDREVQGRYAHTWEEVEIEGVSVGYPSGLAVKLSNNEKKWNTRDNGNGDLLRISQDDARAEDCGGIKK